MVKKEELRIGNFYFHIIFLSPRNLIPYIKTYIYIGRNLFKHAKQNIDDEYYFQDAESYQKVGSFVENKDYEACEITYFTEDRLESNVYDLNKLIIRLDKLKYEIDDIKNFKGNTYYMDLTKKEKKWIKTSLDKLENDK
jgi:hypothetical protein